MVVLLLVEALVQATVTGGRHPHSDTLLRLCTIGLRLSSHPHNFWTLQSPLHCSSTLNLCTCVSRYCRLCAFFASKAQVQVSLTTYTCRWISMLSLVLLLVKQSLRLYHCCWFGCGNKICRWAASQERARDLAAKAGGTKDADQQDLLYCTTWS